MTNNIPADAIIAALGLKPHPEGGYYNETWRDRDGSGTAIYYLLKEGEISAWHRIDATEIWHWYAGAPLRLSIFNNQKIQPVMLGGDIPSGQTPQAIVPPHAWQMAESCGAWSLVGCTVSPAFDFAGFELAPPGWRPLIG
jgi:predicted cupin superfamily sugar epimerase